MAHHIEWTNAHNVRMDVPLGSVGMRVLAYIVDYLIKGAYLLFMFFIVVKIYEDGLSDPNPWMLFIMFSPILFYSLIFEIATDGRSPGKFICSLQAVSIGGESAGSKSYFLRWLFRLFDFILLSQGVALVATLAGSKRQRLGGLVSDTVVIDTTVARRSRFSSHTKVPSSYQPLYPEAKHMKSSDIVLIKDVLQMELGRARDSLIEKLVAKLESTYQFTSKEPPRRTLAGLIKDFNYYKLKE